jgi:oligosaccharide repeat unit polymerase
VFLISSTLFFLYSFFVCKQRNVAFYLSILIGTTFALAFISPLGHTERSFVDYFNLIFTVSLLFVMVHAFRPYHARVIIYPSKEPDLFWPFVYFLIFSLFCALALNIFIVYKSFVFIVTEGSRINEFKNQGLANDLIRRWVNPSLVTAANLISPLGYVALGLHFYFLLQNRRFLSFVFFIFALNLPLSSMHSLSRSGLVHFILIYIFTYVYVESLLTKPMKRFFRKLGLIFSLIMLTVLAFITVTRFGEGSYYSRYTGLGYFWDHNTVLLSLLDYSSSWVTSGLIVLESYTPDKIWFGKSFFKIYEISASIIGLDYQTYYDARMLTLPEHASKFLGLIAVLVYDFGYIFTVVIFALLFFLIRNFAPKTNVIRKKKLLYFPILISVPVMFFTNNYLANTNLSIGILYLVLSALILQSNFRGANEFNKTSYNS